MSELNKVKLGKRLASIESMVTHDYDHIWDCCCDHGLLGFKLLEQGKATHTHFVDIVDPLLIEIEAKLKRFYQGDKHWHVHCVDVAKLPIEFNQGVKHLVIIAGIGGLLLIEILTKLFASTINLTIEFILSPVHHNYQLRTFLKQQHCGLIEERIIEENNRFYEVLHIKNSIGNAISNVGDDMWDVNNLQHRTYLQRTIDHYQRIANNPNIDVSEIIKEYQALLACV